MLKLSLSLLIVLTLAVTSLGNPFTYMPQGHWVYDAVNALIDSTPIPEQDSTEMTRYEAAIMVAKVIQHIDQKEVSSGHKFGVSKDVSLSDMVLQYNSEVPYQYRLADTKVDILYKLASEFRSELEVLGYSIKDVSASWMPNTPISHRAENVFLTEQNLMFRTESLKNTRATQRLLEPMALNSVDRSLHISNYPNSSVVANLSDTWLRNSEATAASQQSLVSRQWFGEESQYTTIVDSKVPLNNDFLLGASFIRREGLEEAPSAPGVAGLAGQYIVSPELLLEGQYLHNTEAVLGTGAMQVGAIVRLGELELGGSLRSLQPGFQPLETLEAVGGGTGYGLSVKLGDLLLSTGRDKILSADMDEKEFTSTSVDLHYGLPNSVLVSAGFTQIDSELKTLAELGQPAKTRVGLDIPIPQGRLRLGVESEWLGSNTETSPASGQMEILSVEENKPESITKKTATVGLSYLLGNETSFQLNYKLIDFSNIQRNSDEQKSNMATAEFSIKF